MVEGYVPVEGGRLWYERAGEGFPVVLIHPGLWDSRIWDGQFDDFALQHDVIRYDTRGYGRSDLPYGPYSDLRDLVHAADLLHGAAGVRLAAHRGHVLRVAAEIGRASCRERVSSVV